VLFTAPQYIFVFLPLVLAVYFTLNRLRFVQCGKAWMVLASLYFYGYWNPAYLVLIIGSMLVNFGLGNALHVVKQSETAGRFSRKTVLVIGIVFNLGILGYYKYSDFLIANANTLLGSDFALLNLLLPLAISFFTFQQIAYLVDCYQFDTQEYDLLSYCLFVSFFPQLIAGPIVHHKEMMPQFSDRRNGQLNYEHLAQGVFIFCIGLFKKVVIADTFAVWADVGFDSGEPLAFFEAWGASLSYTLQLYYDFSGYSDMAIGAALMFNIRLPVNFNSPYKSLNIRDFWRRWHMTLSRWLRDYLYIPLGGNRRGTARVYVNLMATFVLGGLWHGAGWTFILWGALHGVALCVHRVWQGVGLRMPTLLALFITFMFVNFAWVFFRAEDMASAMQMLQGMAGMNGLMGATDYAGALVFIFGQQPGWSVAEVFNRLALFDTALCIVIFTTIALFAKNSLEIGLEKTQFSVKDCFTVSAALMLAILLGIATRSPTFLYFNF
jgi:D-alanyl-lipoteichoic acid acyltransferase DltB (MBOAT superfamily)